MSPATGSRFDVAAAAAEAVRAETPPSAFCRPFASESGDWALKYLPRPLTAACQRSSTVVRSSAFGAGQVFVPCRIASKSAQLPES